MKNTEDYNSEEKGSKASEEAGFSIEGPMLAWILVLIVAFATRLASNYYLDLPQVFGNIAQLILFMPGSFILPIIVGAVIGAGIGKRSKNIASTLKTSMLAAIYASIIYLVAILIIYEIIKYTVPAIVPSASFLLGSWLGLPIATLIVVTVAFSILSNLSKVEQGQ